MRAPGFFSYWLLAIGYWLLALRTAEKCPDNRRRGRLQPPDESDHLSGFSRGLTPCSFDTHQGTRFPSHSAACVSLINFDNTNGQTGAEALNLCQSIGRLKPPASTVAPPFFTRCARHPTRSGPVSAADSPSADRPCSLTHFAIPPTLLLRPSFP